MKIPPPNIHTFRKELARMGERETILIRFVTHIRSIQMALYELESLNGALLVFRVSPGYTKEDFAEQIMKFKLIACKRRLIQ